METEQSPRKLSLNLRETIRYMELVERRRDAMRVVQGVEHEISEFLQAVLEHRGEPDRKHPWQFVNLDDRIELQEMVDANA